MSSRALKTNIRALRPLRLIAKIEGAKVAVIALIKSIKPVSIVAGMVCVFLLVMALFAVALFGGLWYSCMDCSSGVCFPGPIHIPTGELEIPQTCFPYRSYNVENCPTTEQCLALNGSQQWQLPAFGGGGGARFSFDNSMSAVYLLWEISLLELWLEPMRLRCVCVCVGECG